jgi:hypothetical protein
MKKFYLSALMIFVFFGVMQGQAQSPFRGIISDRPVGRGSSPGFYAYPENNIVVIRWQGGDERNVDHFVIEHGMDSIHLAPLHELIAGGSNGDNALYADADSYPDPRENYYRLKVISRDGQVFYSPIVVVDMTGKAVPLLKPTVLHLGNTFRLDNYSGKQPLTVHFFNAGGMRTATYVVNSNYFDINTSGWGKGLYFYRVSDAVHPLINAGKIMIL